MKLCSLLSLTVGQRNLAFSLLPFFMHVLGSPVLVLPYTSRSAWLGYSREYNVIMQIFFCQPRIKFPDLSDEKRKAPGKLQTLPLFLLLAIYMFYTHRKPEMSRYEYIRRGVGSREGESKQNYLPNSSYPRRAQTISLWV